MRIIKGKTLGLAKNGHFFEFSHKNDVKSLHQIILDIFAQSLYCSTKNLLIFMPDNILQRDSDWTITTLKGNLLHFYSCQFSENV